MYPTHCFSPCIVAEFVPFYFESCVKVLLEEVHMLEQMTTFKNTKAFLYSVLDFKNDVNMNA